MVYVTKYLKTDEGEMSLGGICLVAGLGGKDEKTRNI